MLVCDGVGLTGSATGGHAVEAGFEDGVDGGVGDRVDGQRPLAGRLKPIPLVATGQRKDTKREAVSLLGMGTVAHHPLDQDAVLAPIPAACRIRFAGVVLA
ncbi:hypothetical protein X756_31450 [Mesorhizobium sp. LSHC412B00]|nr:hypothetical protein X756_31450 [Mesorhizobium sp. LSHC412B00]